MASDKQIEKQVEIQAVQTPEDRRIKAKERAKNLTRKKQFNYAQHGINENDKRFHFHWSNIDGARGSNLDMYLENGYSKCLDKEGHDIRRKGHTLGHSQILLRIPIEEYNLIQHYKLDEPREIQKSIGKKDIANLPEEHIYGDVITTSEIIK